MSMSMSMSFSRQHDKETTNKKNVTTKNKNDKVLVEHSRSVAFQDLPPVPDKEDEINNGCILLFYQYKEPSWTSKEHKQALKKLIEIANLHHVTGRGRVAPEGVNCTLTCQSSVHIRDFCRALRAWDAALYDPTDFKITDNIGLCKVFKSLSIRKTNELVAYGMAGDDRAPSLAKFSGIHLEAPAYHKAIQDSNAVIIDVRNAYESAIGSFQPPPGGAQLLDPRLRNSIEFPKWLNDPKTQDQLSGKKVLMYCTGGIRCERAAALLNQMATANPDKVKPEGVYELRGGIERYVKTFPEGGYWKGKNYLFDRRMEQEPAATAASADTAATSETDRKNNVGDDPCAAATATTGASSAITSKCCVCRKPWSVYRGKFKCSHSQRCGVPVIVCESCRNQYYSKEAPGRLLVDKVSGTELSLMCELCRVGYQAPQALPDLVGQKRKAESLVDMDDSLANNRKESSSTCITTEEKSELNGLYKNNKKHRALLLATEKRQQTDCKKSTDTVSQQTGECRVFLRKLPLSVTKTKLTGALLGTGTNKSNNNNNSDGDNNDDESIMVHWLTDKKTGAFYGSCVVQLPRWTDFVKEALQRGILKVDKKKAKITVDATIIMTKNGDNKWPPEGYEDREYPPVGR